MGEGECLPTTDATVRVAVGDVVYAGSPEYVVRTLAEALQRTQAALAETADELGLIRAVLRRRGLLDKVRKVEKPCKRPGCERTFLVIAGTREARREFCCDTCRVMDYRARKDEREGLSKEPRKPRRNGPFDYTNLGPLS